MFEKRKALALVLTIAAGALLVPRSQALTDEEIFRQLRFNFINPGGRALGIGGTFIALADDATAAQANPAGLMQLAAPEFFLEERYLGSDSATGSAARSFGGGSGFALSSSNERRDITTPTFFSYVIPWKHFALGVSRQEVLNTRVKVDSTFDDRFLFDQNGDGTVELTNATWSGNGVSTVQVTNWNLAVAWRPVSWFLVGATGSYGQLHIDASTANTVLDKSGLFLCRISINCDPDLDGIPDPPSSVPALQHPQNWYSTRIDDDDSQLTYSAGLLFLVGDKFSVGGVYRADTKYKFKETLTDGLSSQTFGGSPNFLYNKNATTAETLHLPSSYGLGVKWRPTSNLTIVADGIRIKYSDLLDGLHPNLNILTNLIGRTGPNSFIDDGYVIDDVTEVHVGAEYLFTGGSTPWAIRVGAYNDPDNVLRADSAFASSFFGDSLGGRKDEYHYTAGFGLVVKEKFQADVAVSYSSIGTEGVVSFIHRF